MTVQIEILQALCVASVVFVIIFMQYFITNCFAKKIIAEIRKNKQNSIEENLQARLASVQFKHWSE